MSWFAWVCVELSQARLWSSSTLVRDGAGNQSAVPDCTTCWQVQNLEVSLVGERLELPC